MPDQKGMPVWDKMQVLDNAEKTVLYVPLSEDKTAGLSSLLIVKVDEKNSVFHLQNFTNDYLKAYVYNTGYPATRRKLLMDTFLQMDFFTFGHQEFTNLPKDIYKGSLEYNRLNILDAKIVAEQSKGFIYNTICTTSHYCVHGDSIANCDYGNCQCGGLIKCFVVTSCSTTATWIDDPFPSSPVGGGGGGGGAAPSPEGIPPVDPCTQSGMPFYRILPQCAGNMGDGIDDGVLEDPCDKIKQHFSDNRFKNQFNNLNKQENFNADHEIGFAEKVSVINGSQVKTFTPLNNEPCSKATVLPADKTGLIGWGHTHHDIGCDGFENIKVPSPDDIRVFLFTQLQQSFNILGNYSDAYGLTVTSGGSYMLMYTGIVPPNISSFNSTALKTEYKRIFNNLNFNNSGMPQDKVEVAFTKFLKEKINIDRLELYKVTPTSSEKLEYNPTTQTMNKLPCP